MNKFYTIISAIMLLLHGYIPAITIFFATLVLAIIVNSNIWVALGGSFAIGIVGGYLYWKIIPILTKLFIKFRDL